MDIGELAIKVTADTVELDKGFDKAARGLVKFANRLKNETRSPLEEFERRLKKIRETFEKGLIDSSTMDRAIDQAKEKLRRATERSTPKPMREVIAHDGESMLEKGLSKAAGAGLQFTKKALNDVTAAGKEAVKELASLVEISNQSGVSVTTLSAGLYSEADAARSATLTRQAEMQERVYKGIGLDIQGIVGDMTDWVLATYNGAESLEAYQKEVDETHRMLKLLAQDNLNRAQLSKDIESAYNNAGMSAFEARINDNAGYTDEERANLLAWVDAAEKKQKAAAKAAQNKDALAQQLVNMEEEIDLYKKSAREIDLYNAKKKGADAQLLESIKLHHDWRDAVAETEAKAAKADEEKQERIDRDAAAFQRTVDFADQLRERLRSPAEVFEQEVKRLNEAMKAGQISQALYDKAMAEAISNRDSASGAGREEQERVDREATAYQRVVDFADDLRDKLRTPAEAFAMQMRKIDEALKAGEIDQDLYDRAKAAAEKERDKDGQKTETAKETGTAGAALKGSQEAISLLAKFRSEGVDRELALQRQQLVAQKQIEANTRQNAQPPVANV